MLHPLTPKDGDCRRFVHHVYPFPQTLYYPITGMIPRQLLLNCPALSAPHTLPLWKHVSPNIPGK